MIEIFLQDTHRTKFKLWQSRDIIDIKLTLKALTDIGETTMVLEQIFRIQHRLMVENINLALSHRYSRVGDEDSKDVKNFMSTCVEKLKYIPNHD